MGVGAYGEHFDSHGFQLFVLLCQVLQLSGADEGEVGRVEEEQCPFAFDIVIRNCFELSVLKSLDGELWCVCIDNWFHVLIVLCVESFV